MVRHRLNIARMIYKLDFGHEYPTDQINPNTGKPMKEFKPEIKNVYAAKWSLNQADLLSLAGRGINDEMVFAIRHAPRITSDFKIRLGDEIFEIDTDKYSEDLTPDAYDLIYCHHYVSKHN